MDCRGVGTVARVAQPACVGGVTEVGRAQVAVRAGYSGEDARESETVTRPAHVRLDRGLDGGAKGLWWSMLGRVADTNVSRRSINFLLCVFWSVLPVDSGGRTTVTSSTKGSFLNVCLSA